MGIQILGRLRGQGANEEIRGASLYGLPNRTRDKPLPYVLYIQAINLLKSPHLINCQERSKFPQKFYRP